MSGPQAWRLTPRFFHTPHVLPPTALLRYKPRYALQRYNISDGLRYALQPDPSAALRVTPCKVCVTVHYSALQRVKRVTARYSALQRVTARRVTMHLASHSLPFLLLHGLSLFALLSFHCDQFKASRALNNGGLCHLYRIGRSGHFCGSSCLSIVLTVSLRAGSKQPLIRSRANCNISSSISKLIDSPRYVAGLVRIIILQARALAPSSKRTWSLIRAFSARRRRRRPRTRPGSRVASYSPMRGRRTGTKRSPLGSPNPSMPSRPASSSTCCVYRCLRPR